MKKIQKIFTALLLVSGSAQATVSTGTFVLYDWTTLLVEFDNGVSLTYDEQWSESSVSVVADQGAAAVQDEQSFSGWVDTEATVTILPNAFANAWTGDPQATGVDNEVAISLDGLADGINNSYTSLSGTAERWADFTISGSGMVTFSVDYSIDLGVINDVPGELAFASGAIGLLLENYDDNTDDDYSDSINIDLSMGADSVSGTASVSLFFNDGDQGYFSAAMESEGTASTVPVPASFCLMFPALFGFFKRRKTC